MVVSKNIKYLGGSPNINSSRLSVYNVLVYLGSDTDPITSFMEDYNLSINDIKEILNYCMKLDCIDAENVCAFCEGCILNHIINSDYYENLRLLEISKGIFQSNLEENWIYLTADNEDISNFEQERGWKIAESLYEKLKPLFCVPVPSDSQI